MREVGICKTLWPLESIIRHESQRRDWVQNPNIQNLHPRFPQQALNFVEIVVFARNDQLGTLDQSALC